MSNSPPPPPLPKGVAPAPASTRTTKIVRSRKGCLACKRRRVKCDEKRPKCGHCIRRQEDCQYHATIAKPYGFVMHEPAHLQPASPLVLVQNLPAHRGDRDLAAFEYYCNEVIPGNSEHHSPPTCRASFLLNPKKLAQLRQFEPVNAFLSAVSKVHRAIWDRTCPDESAAYFRAVIRGFDALAADAHHYPDEVVLLASNLVSIGEVIRTADTEWLNRHYQVIYDALSKCNVEWTSHDGEAVPDFTDSRLERRLRPYHQALLAHYREALHLHDQRSGREHALLQYMDSRSCMAKTPFTSFQMAAMALENISLHQWIGFSGRKSSRWMAHIDFDTTDLLLDDWSKMFDDFLHRRKVIGIAEWRIAVSLRMHWTIAKLNANWQLFVRKGLIHEEIDFVEKAVEAVEWLFPEDPKGDDVKTSRKLPTSTLAVVYHLAAKCRFGPVRRRGLRLLERMHIKEHGWNSRVAWLIAKTMSLVWADFETLGKVASEKDDIPGTKPGRPLIIRPYFADCPPSRVWEPMTLSVKYEVYYSLTDARYYTAQMELNRPEDISACRAVSWPLSSILESSGYGQIHTINIMGAPYLNFDDPDQGYGHTAENSPSSTDESVVPVTVGG